MEQYRKELFEKMKRSHFFWSYSEDIEFEDVSEEILVETALKYGDVDDIERLFACYDYADILDAWAKRLLFDKRFDKLNFYLSKIFFDIDLSQMRQEMARYDRANKLGMLASQDRIGAEQSDR